MKEYIGPILADFDLGRVIGPALTTAIVPIALSFLMRSAQQESIAAAGSRSVAYPKAMRVFVMLGWVFTVVIAIFAGFTAKSADIKNAAMVVGLFVVLILPLHLEAFGVLISWDDANIYTRSPWRGRRTIPFTAVKSCNYSTGMQWYRIHTDGYGIIRLHLLMRGIPELLAALPCPAPPYPPDSQTIAT